MDPIISAVLWEVAKGSLQQFFIFARQAGKTKEEIDAEWQRSRAAADARPAEDLTPPPQ